MKNETPNSTVCIHPLYISIYMSQFPYFLKKKTYYTFNIILILFVLLEYVIVKYTGIRAAIVVIE